MNELYGSAAGYLTYFTGRGTIVEDDETEIGAALLVASEWIDAVFSGSFPGLKVGQRDQVREWPRTGAYDQYGHVIPSDQVPREIEHATYQAASRQLASPGSLSVDYTPSKYKSVSVDGAVSVTFAGFGGAADVQTKFAIIEQILAPILVGAGGYSPLTGDAVRV